MYKSSERFLVNKKILNKIYFSLKKNNYLEVGGGYGNVSDYIIKRIKKKTLYIYEVNKKFFIFLKKKYKKNKKVFLYKKNFLKVKDFPKFKEKFNLFSSIPFHITSDMLVKFFKINKITSRLYLIIQEEYFFNKINNKKKYFYYLFNYYFKIIFYFKISGKNYYPKVKKDTLFISIKSKKIFSEKFNIFILKKSKYIFQYKDIKFFRKKKFIYNSEFIIYSMYLYLKRKKIFKEK
ncbi:rRNA adenine N-6-methyltransferase family protein [Candidatus Vidania fulgoroideorum]